MSRRPVVIGVAACLLLAGCGSSSSHVSSGVGNTLRADVLALTQAAAAQQWSSADRALAQLRTDYTAAVTAGGLSPDQAQTIHADVDKVAADLAAHRVAATPKTSSSSTTAPKPAPQPHEPKPKPPKPPKDGHDHGHGPGGGEGGD